MTQLPGELTVGQLSARSGVAVSALHYYEAKGLIGSRRTTGNQRRYARDALRRVAFIRVSQRVGVPLAEIRTALAGLPEGRTPDRADWTRLSAVWRRRLDARIDQLLRLRDNLDDCIGCGCLSLDRCALSNPGDLLAATGTGPRRLLAEPVPASGEACPPPPVPAGGGACPPPSTAERAEGAAESRPRAAAETRCLPRTAVEVRCARR